jgi:radical S-adenosyl methionine domain-containing protein 2
MKTQKSNSNSKDEPDSKPQLITAVNFHLWQACNFRCRFCFATFADVKREILPKGHLPREQAIKIIQELAAAGFEKITFAGGEPTLCPWLPELVYTAKIEGMTTGMITNGSRLKPDYLKQFEGNLDWIGISIDSLNADTNLKAGRIQGKINNHEQLCYRTLCKMVTDAGFKLKINTVVHAYNKAEAMYEFIHEVKPLRWKIMRVLPVDGQNDQHYQTMSVTEEEFNSYVANNTLSGSNLIPVVEDHSAIRGSYMMIDPSGRFFDNVTGGHRYSLPILEVGVKQALNDIEYAYAKFIERNGKYDW